MNTPENLKAISAHFDGQQIHLDEPYPLKQDDKLLIVVLQDTPQDDERFDWTQIFLQGLENAYGKSEPEYSLNTVKEANPDYEGR